MTSELEIYLEEENIYLQEKIAKLREELDDLQKHCCQLAKQRDETQVRAERAEARIAEAEKQEPFVWALEGEYVKNIAMMWDYSATDKQMPYDPAITYLSCCEVGNGLPLWRKPIPTADVAELLKALDGALLDLGFANHLATTWKELADVRDQRIAELERKLAEQQALCTTLAYNLRGFGINPSCNGTEELNTLLAKAREEGRKEAVPDGWQIVPKEPTSDMLIAGQGQYYHTPSSHWNAMLAAAPKPEEIE